MSGKWRMLCVGWGLLIASVLRAQASAYGVEVPTVQINGYSVEGASYEDLNQGLYYKGLGDLLYRKHLYAEAIRRYERALTHMPTEADIFLGLGSSYLEQGLSDLAVVYLQKAIDYYDFPENLGKVRSQVYLARIRLARAYHMMGSHSRGQALLTELQVFRAEVQRRYPSILEEWDKVYQLVHTVE